MTGARAVGIAMFVALLGGGTAAEQPVELHRLFPKQAKITTEQDGLARLPLPAEVLAACRPDLSDLRIFDASGREVAYLADSARGLDVGVAATESFNPEVLSVRRDEETPEHAPPTHREWYELAIPPPSEAGDWELLIDTTVRRFTREVDVAVARDGERVDLVTGFPLFRLDADTQRTRIPLGALSGDHLIVAIRGRDGTYLEPSFRFESVRTFDPLRRIAVPLAPLSSNTEGGITSIEFERPSGIVPDALELRTGTGSFSRTVRVWDVRAGEDDAPLGMGELYRVAGPRGARHLAVSVRAASGHGLRVEIEGADSPPLVDVEVDAVLSGPVLIFELPGGAREAMLRFGGGRAYRPRYDLSALLLREQQTLSGDPARAAAELYDPSALGLALLGSIAANPDFDASPALAFAMHPGSEIDTRAFEFRRALAIVPAPEGLSRLSLAPEDVAVARADLSDIRIVDADGNQWPYLVERRAGSATVPLRLIDQSRDGRSSVYRLEPGVAPLPLLGMHCDVEVAYFDRPYELRVTDEEGHERTAAHGRIRKDGRNPKPVSITFDAGRVSALELRIEDGDDAPLELGSVVGHLALADLFLVAGEGEYHFLVGNPEASAPRYELERVRDVVLAVNASAVVSGPLEENPRFSARSRLTPNSSVFQKAIVWIVLLLAVAILAALTLRVARREPSEPA